MRSASFLLLPAVVCAAAYVTAAETKPSVSLVVAVERGSSITGSNDWYKVLTEAGVTSLTVRQAATGDEAALTTTSVGGVTLYSVTGVVSSSGVLHLPGGKFTLRDGAKLKRWLANLSEGGVEAVTQPRSAFGMLPSQLRKVEGELKRSVPFATAGTPARKTVDEIAKRLPSPLSIDRSADAALAESTVDDELRGLSSGTALAAALRPAGLVLVPESAAGGALRYRVIQPAAGVESWPVGWEPADKPARILPALFELVDAEIDDTPVAEAVTAIAERLKLPVLYDHNSLAERDIDPRAIQAKLPAKRLSYSLVLSRVLAQAKLRYELRVDEAARPFLWISTH